MSKTIAAVGASRRRHRIRVVVLGSFVAVPLLAGWLIRPRVQEVPNVVGPSVVVLASQPGVAATVNATLSLDHGHESHASELQLQLLATSKISGTVGLTVELNDFPSGTTVAGARIVPVRPPAAGSVSAALPVAAVPYPPGYRDYAVPAALTRLKNSSPALTTITILAPKPIGEDSRGAQLRVAFPVLRGEGPGANASAVYQIQDLFPGASSLPGSGQGHPVALQAGRSTFSAAGISLASYQILAGDPPTLLSTKSWAWDGINDATVLAANVHTQDIEQLKVFWSGLAIGLASATVIALILELIPAEPGTGSEETLARDNEPTETTP